MTAKVNVSAALSKPKSCVAKMVPLLFCSCSLASKEASTAVGFMVAVNVEVPEKAVVVILKKSISLNGLTLAVVTEPCPFESRVMVLARARVLFDSTSEIPARHRSPRLRKTTTNKISSRNDRRRGVNSGKSRWAWSMQFTDCLDCRCCGTVPIVKTVKAWSNQKRSPLALCCQVEIGQSRGILPA